MTGQTALFNKPKLVHYCCVLVGAILLFIPALYNGYTILNNDDATYLWAGFTPETPIDRPIAYGIFLRIFSFNGITLQTCAMAQCWLMSWLIVRLFRRLVSGPRSPLYALSAILVLTFSSSLAWISSEILPDFLTPVALLCLILILLQKETKALTGLLFFLYTLCISTHMSHVPIFTVILFTTLLFSKWLFHPAQFRVALMRLFLAIFLTLSSILTMGYALANSKHVFGVASILEQGILKPYLDETCPTEHYKICAFKDDLNTNANFFLWYAESPMNLTGGWEANRDEYNRILKGTYTKPKYIFMRMKMSVVFTCRQLIEFGVGDGNYPVDLLKRLREFVPGDEQIFLAALQHKDILLPKLAFRNTIIYVVVLLSLVILLLQMLFSKKQSGDYKLFVFLVFVGILVNIWVCASFGQVNGRYGCRVMWLVPLCAAISLFRQFMPIGSAEKVSDTAVS